MKTLTTKTILFSIFLLLALSVKAQTDDYAITKNGDTVKCLMTFPDGFTPTDHLYLGGANIKYRTGDTYKEGTISPFDFKEFYCFREKLLCRSVFIKAEEGRTFMKVLEKGKINLYQFAYPGFNITNQSRNQSYYVIWYVSKGSDTVKELKTDGFIMKSRKKERLDNLAEMLMDNKAVYDKFMVKNVFSFGRLRNFVHLYNTGELWNNRNISDLP